MCIRDRGSLSFGGIRDIRDSLKRLDVGSSLGIVELLAVSALLTAAARAKNYGRREESELPDDSLDGMFRALEPLTPVNNEIKRLSLIHIYSPFFFCSFPLLRRRHFSLMIIIIA